MSKPSSHAETGGGIATVLAADMGDKSKAERIWRPLAADIRQAVVGWIVLLAIPLAGVVLLAALGGEVPAWTLAAPVALGAILLVAFSLEHRRELGRAEGALSSERERREKAEQELATAREELAVAQAGTDRKARSTAREGLLFRIDTLRDEVVDRRNSGWNTTSGQDQALHSLAKDVREQCGPSVTVDQVIRDWNPPVHDRGSDDAAAALGQLKGIVMSAQLASETN